MGKQKYEMNTDSNWKYDYIYSNDEIELIIPDYPKGSDITIINTAYFGRYKNPDTDKVEQDFITITFRDNTTGAKKTHTIYEPLYTFYKLKEGYKPTDYTLFFIEKDKVYPCTCRYADLLRAIAQITGNERFYKDNVNNGNSSENRKLHTCTDIFMSDMNIENYYRFLFSRSYPNNIFKLSKGFIDIETDGRYSDTDGVPEAGTVPINAIAYCDESHNTTYQFLLNDKNNPLVQKYMESFNNEDILSELKAFVINAVGGYKKAVKFGVDKMEYKIVFFDDELTMIKKMFEVINATCPDFIEIWNWDFDFNFFVQRVINLGGDPQTVLCDPRIFPSYIKFFVDERNRNEYEERGDYLHFSSFTVWLDQMIEFASRRKGRGRYPSFKLDYIGEAVAGVKKLDYSHITNDILMLPYLDMKTFSFYNVMDVIVQKCIEVSTQDCEYVFNKCLVNNTIYPKCHRQSVYLANRFSAEFYNYGYIIGNNKNLWNEKPTVKFPGALVGDPLHIDDHTKIHINGRPVMLVDNSVDFD